MSSSPILRTPDDRFNHLPGYPFEPHYHEVAPGLRMHYVDEPGTTGETVLLLHGEPSWSYLYRKMIPILNNAGHRVVAPDLIGFGRSDKPTKAEVYTYQSHLDWVSNLVESLDLQNITLFCQDWGGLLGLKVAVNMKNRFSRIMASNTFLPTGDQPPNEAFSKWLHFSQTTEVFPVGFILNKATVTELPQEIMDAYDAPFPSEEYKVGARVFPTLVPITPDNPASESNRQAWKELMQWEKPFLTAFGDSDPIMHGVDKILQEKIPGAKGQPHRIIQGGGHFIQEDKGEELAELLVEFVGDN